MQIQKKYCKYMCNTCTLRNGTWREIKQAGDLPLICSLAGLISHPVLKLIPPGIAGRKGARIGGQ